MNGEQVLDHVLGLVGHFKRKRDDNDLSAGEAAVYLKYLAILGAKEAVISMNQIEALSDKMRVVELPFEVRA